MSVSENERISEQFICFYPNILVEYVEKTEKVFDRPITIFEGRIEFDSDVIKNKIDKIIDEYEISFSLSEPEPGKWERTNIIKYTKKGIVHTYKKYKYKEKINNIQYNKKCVYLISEIFMNIPVRYTQNLIKCSWLLRYFSLFWGRGSTILFPVLNPYVFLKRTHF